MTLTRAAEARLVENERRCCSFLGFTIELPPDEKALEDEKPLVRGARGVGAGAGGRRLIGGRNAKRTRPALRPQS